MAIVDTLNPITRLSHDKAFSLPMKKAIRRRRKLTSSPISVMEMEMPPAKRVRFSQNNENTVVEVPRRLKETKSDTWYAKTDYQTFVKEAATYAVKSNERSYMSTLDLTFTHSFFQTTTQKKDVTIATFQDAYHLAIAQTNLEKKSRNGETARGIERLMSPFLIGGTTKFRQKKAVKSIVSTYKKRRNQHMDQSITEEMLRQLSEQTSEPSKKFARTMGMVDALSVYGGEV